MKKNNLTETINFLEELSWVLDKKKLNLKDVVASLRQINSAKTVEQNPMSTRHLVGILPSLFLDEGLFPKKDDILEFADKVLNLKLSKEAKRSKTEYIGMIVCRVAAEEDDNTRKDLVDALESLIGNETKMKKVREEKNKPNFSWNDTIAKLSEL